MTTAARTSRSHDAVEARRRELTTIRSTLDGRHRSDLRTALELARLHCSEQLTVDLDVLTRRVGNDLLSAGGAERSGFSERLSRELDAVRLRSADRIAVTAGPVVARVAARLCPGAAPMPLPVSEADVRDTGPQDAGPRGGGPGTLAGAVADPRLLTGLAGLPLLGAGGVGYPVALWTAGVLLLAGVLVRTRVVASGRARCRAELAREVATAVRSGERELHRRFVEIGAAAGSALDRAVAERLARLDAELRAPEAAR